MSSSQSSLGRRKRGSQSAVKRNSSSTTTSRSTGAYDRAFTQNLIDHACYPPGYEYPDGELLPELDNINEITAEFARHRASLSPSQFSSDDFRKFTRVDTHAAKEAQVMSKVIPIIEGDVRDSKSTASDVIFASLEPLTDGTLMPAMPDLYYGARPEQLDRKVRQDLERYIIPSTQHDLPIIPTFSLEAKGSDGSLSVATRQMKYVGAIGARATLRLQSYNDPHHKYANKAYALASIYHGGQLKIYANYPIEPREPGKPPGYATAQIAAYAMTHDLETFRKGAAAFRNSRDWAERQRNNAI
jgi:hypothetical protein